LIRGALSVLEDSKAALSVPGVDLRIEYLNFKVPTLLKPTGSHIGLQYTCQHVH
jgi:hypothetical protein